MAVKQIAYCIAAAACWLAFFWSTYQGIKQRKETKLRRLFSSRGLLLAFVLAITFRIRIIHSALTSLTGVNNLALLLSYGTAATAITVVIQTMYVRLFAARRFPWLFTVVSMAVLAMSAVFPSVANSPDIYASELAPTRAVLRFRFIFYAYAAWLSGLTAVRYHQLRQDAPSPATRLRWTMGKYGMVTAVSYCIGRAMEAGFLWISLTPEANAGFKLLHIVNAIVLAVGTMMWVLFFTGGTLFEFITHLEIRLDQMKTLRDLRRVGAIAAAYGGRPLPKLPLPWWLCLDRGLYIHLTMISILDNRRLMAVARRLENGTNAKESASPTQQEAAAVYALLESVEHQSQADYQSLVHAYRELAGQQFSNSAAQPFSQRSFKLTH